MSRYIGDVSAYALAVSQGYTGTEEEYAELMASYATVGQTAVAAAQTATTKASEAATSATTATNKASEATTAAQTATSKAAEASTSASTATSAKDTAVGASQTATTKAGEATTAAATATSAATTAETAATNAQAAQTAAETAQEAAEDAAESVSASAAQIATNTADITELKEELTHIATDDNHYIYAHNNICDLAKLTTGYRFKADGSGELEARTDSAYSDYIWVDSIKYNYLRARYIKTGSGVTTATIRCVMYDADKNIIGFDNGGNMSIPYGTMYIRYSTFTDAYGGSVGISTSLMLFLIKDAYATFTNPTEYVGYNRTTINRMEITENLVTRPTYKIVVNGDSITYGYNPTPSSDAYADMSQNGYDSYVRKVCDKLGYFVENYSVVNSKLGDYANDGTTNDPLCVRYINMPSDADLVYICIGSNDATGANTLGTMADRLRTSFYGALHILCQGLREKYTDVPIVFATPIKRVYDANTMTPVNMDDYIIAIKTVCGYYGIPVLDLYNESRTNAWIAYDVAHYIPDGIHPNLAGHKRIAIAFEKMCLSYLPQGYVPKE